MRQEDGEEALSNVFPTLPVSHEEGFLPMKKDSKFGTRSRTALRCGTALLALWLSSCGSSVDSFVATSNNVNPGPTSSPSTGPVAISPLMPVDIPGGSPNSSLRQAGIFAWQEFIALNWPAVPQTGALGTRDTPDLDRLFGASDQAGPLVWETFRHKSEIFPGIGDPRGFELGPENDFGYDQLPRYVYADPQPIGDGSPAPFNNLDESSEIAIASMFAGIGPTEGPVGQQILYQAKANRTQYVYVASNGWYGAVAPPFQATVDFVSQNLRDPLPGSTDLVSFPTGTIELKTAFRKLGPTEDPGRFYTSRARHYESLPGGGIGYRDDIFALVGFHIIHKTPTAPYFTYATFEQVDNILDQNGRPVENPDGSVASATSDQPLDPNIISIDAIAANPPTLDTIQKLFPKLVDSIPGVRLYYRNTSNTTLPQGTVSVNHRTHTVSPQIVEVNKAAHAAIADYNARNGIAESPWQYYKLVNIQAKPIDKPVPGQPYTEEDASTYYLSNSVVETDFNLQNFSGRFQPSTDQLTQAQVTDLITDYNADGTPFKNIVFEGRSFNMGGCMGCHGMGSVLNGSGSSFLLLGGRVTEPDPVGVEAAESERLRKLKEFLHK
jgi:hypothetical protein